MRLTSLDRFLLLSIILLLVFIAWQNTRMAPGPVFAQTATEDGFPLKITNASEIGGGIAAFPVDDQGRFVIVDASTRQMLFCEVIWTGAESSLSVRYVKEF